MPGLPAVESRTFDRGFRISDPGILNPGPLIPE
jgi:hypothetical protein